MHDVVIVGGSFAGLAVAMQLRGRSVLIIDQHPIGSHQMSTCGIPLRLATLLGARDGVKETHDSVVLHVGGKAIRFAFPEPYATFDYRVFCERMLAGTDAEIMIARATERRPGHVVTTCGEVAGRFIVVTSGWRSYQADLAGAAREQSLASRGLETEIPMRVAVEPGLHFFFERRIVEGGYAWIFPCGDSTRIGLCSTRPNMALRQRLDRFAAEVGVEIGPTHGGVMPFMRRDPIDGDAFLVGDAAGQCLPVTAEGIRVAVLHSLAYGYLIRKALSGEISAAEARRRYRQIVGRTDRGHRRLLRYMAAIERTPEALLATAARTASRTRASNLILRRYLAGTGWPAGDLRPPA